MRLFSDSVLKTIVLVAALCAAQGNAFADTASTAANVTTATVAVGAPYPYVPPGGEQFYNVGGFCKVVDVTPTANEMPVFIDGDASQWESWRQSEVSKPTPGVTVLTCCPPQANITTLCNEAGATPQEVSRAYGKNGEVDSVSMTCKDEWGDSYVDTVAVACTGSDAADGTAQWVVSGADATSGCTADAYDTGCYAACDSTSSGTRYDSCGNATNYSCYGGACPPPPPPPPTSVPSCTPEPYCCSDGTCWSDCSGGAACENSGSGTCSTCSNPSGDGSTWGTSPSCTSCQCGECENHVMVNSGVGCCVENGNCNPGGSCL